MSKEIGGYLGLEEFFGREYHADLLALNTGRNALVYLLKARQVKKLYIPTFLCDCVERVCIREGFAYEKYSVGADFLPRFSGMPGEGEWVYVVNYYGQVSDEALLAMQKKWGRILVDHVQDFFRKPLPGVDTLYSCRKFFGVADGAYLSSDAVLALEKDASRDRMAHVLGRFETTGSQYYGAFQASDESLYDLPLREMSPVTQNLLRGVDYDRVCHRRTENYKTLAGILGGQNKLQPVLTAGPYCYPFYCEKGMAVKKALAAQKLYVPTLWPNVAEDALATETEKDMACNILPLPCDQRYDAADMQRLAEAVLTCMTEVTSK